jgi:iron-sulfur cluster repair protein YtfE (RIC family)
MVHLGWSRPSEPVNVDTARRGILAQHVQIRRLLHNARDLADVALDGHPPSPDAVASSIGDIRATIEVHLTFEESVLVPLWNLDGPQGERRSTRMLDEHRRQRELMAALHREAMAHPHLPILSAKLAFLATWLLADMTEEEKTLTGDPL